MLDARTRHGLVAVFDFDGTLVKVARAPEAVHVGARTFHDLETLAERADTTVSVVSGRPLDSLARLVPAPSVWLFGLHGWEYRAPRGEPVRLWSPDTLALARRQRAILVEHLGPPQGERIEDKGPMVAVHTRNATPARRREVEAIVRAARLPALELVEGRRVLELRPAGSPTKGTAIRLIAATRPTAPILFIGDDTTDEDGFAVLSSADFGVLVDDERARDERPHGSTTRARFTVPGTDAVAHVLHTLLGEASCPS